MSNANEAGPTPKPARFNKAAVLAGLDKKIAWYVGEYGFTEDNGYAQVEGLSEEKNREYGAFSALCDLRDDIRDGWPL